MTPPQDEEDDDIDSWPVCQVMTRAGSVPLPVTRAARSVFELVVPAAPPPKRTKRREPLACISQLELFDWLCDEPNSGRKTAQIKPQRTVMHALRDGAGVKVCGLAYPGNRWTPEKEEKERARRARQVLPKPPRQTFRLKKD